MQNLKQHKEKIIGILMSLIFITLVLWNLDIKMLLDTFKTFNYKVLILFIPLYILSLYTRGARWKFLLCNNNKLSIKEAFFAFTTGNTINSYFPARAGDFWRAYHIGKKLDESKIKMLGSIILERIIDGISILLILSFAVITYAKQTWILNLTYLTAALFLGSLLIIFLILKFNKTEAIINKLISIKYLEKFKHIIIKIGDLFNKFLEGFNALNSTKFTTLSFLASIFAWGLECILTFGLILGFGHHYGISIAFFIISFIALSTIIPSSSVFVGPYQYAYILALGIYHIPKANALAIAFIHQISIMIVITIISIIYFSCTNTKLTDIKQEIEANNANNA